MSSTENTLNSEYQNIFNEALKIRDEGRSREAIGILENIAKHYPNFAPTYGIIGGILRELGEMNKAAHYFKKVVELKPMSELGSLGLFHSFWAMGLKKEALDEIKRFQRISHSEEYDSILKEIDEKLRDA